MKPETRKIVEEVAELYDISVKMLLGREFQQNLSGARQHLYKRLQSERGLSLSQISIIAGGRDHSSIYRAIQAPPGKPPSQVPDWTWHTHNNRLEKPRVAWIRPQYKGLKKWPYGKFIKTPERKPLLPAWPVAAPPAT